MFFHGKYLVAACLCVYFFETTAQSVTSPELKEHQCQVRFSEDEKDVSRYLENCFAGIGVNDVSSISLIIRSRVRKRLSPAVKRAERRRDELRTEIKKRFPNSTIQEAMETRADVEDDALLTLVKRPQPSGIDLTKLSAQLTARFDELRPSLAVISTPPSPKPQLPMVLQIFLGKDSFRSASFRSMGFRGMWAPVYRDWIRGEFGLKGGVLAADEFKDIYHASMVAGAGFTQGAFVLSPHILVGIVSTQERTFEADIGGEVSAGIELPPLALGLNFGMTQKTRQLGLQVGVKL